MKVRTRYLEGRQLDAAVCLAQGWTMCQYPEPASVAWVGPYPHALKLSEGPPKPNWKVFDGEAEQPLAYLEYHANWILTGELIAEYSISVMKAHPTDPIWGARRAWADTVDTYGPTPQVAVARCFVLSRLGELVDLPED